MRAVRKEASAQDLDCALVDLLQLEQRLGLRLVGWNLDSMVLLNQQRTPSLRLHCRVHGGELL